jgi:Ca2+-binding RTX toxin-like protein
MTILYDFRRLDDATYKEYRYNALLWIEEKGIPKPEPYSDNPTQGGYATIGVGFKIDSNWDDILKAYGFDTRPTATAVEKGYILQLQTLVGTNRKFTGAQMSTLITQLNAVMLNRFNYYKNAFQDETKRQTFTFSDGNEVKSTFQIIADRREDILMTWLGETTKYSIVPQGNERITLLSLVFNNIIKPGESPSLLAAIKNGNRAEAWFEIRYNTNKAGTGMENGIAKRRYYEADLFGLYNNPNSITEDESKTVMRMYTLHKDKIDSYEGLYHNQVTKANTDYNVTWVKTLESNLNDAKSYLIVNFATNIGMSIDGEVIVGAGLSSYAYKEKTNINDTGAKSLIGTDKKDLIFGEAGNDSIDGGANNDVIYGGTGDDTITGGKGNDYLIGGIGNDTYVYTIGDGNDWIYDEDNKGKIVVKKEGVDKDQAIGTVYEQKDVNGANIWKNANGTIEITHNSPWTIVLEDGSTITLGEDFESGDFGINLLDMPEDPNPTFVITGDLAPLNDPVHYDALGNVIVDPNTPAPDRNDTLFGSVGNDKIEGMGGSDIVYGQGGNDWVLGGTGRDGLSTGDGSDIIEGGTEGDLIISGAGDDQLFGESQGEMEDLVAAGEDAVNIDAQGDLVSGQDGNDFIYGSNANDAFFGGAGSDLIVGGGGNDIILSGDNASGALFAWSYTINNNGGIYEPVITNVDYNMSEYGEYIDSGNDAVYAGTGNDFVYAAGGDDEVYGGSGNDTIFGWGGSDNLFGEDGDDVLIGDNDVTVLALDKHGDDYIDGGAGNDTILGYGGSDQLFGGDGNDYIDGGAGDDYLDGEAGNDILLGAAGNDTLFGGDGNDELNGDAADIEAALQGDDYLDGQAGDDSLYGYAGNDTLYGGDGNDQLLGDDTLAGGDDYLDGGAGDDTMAGMGGADTLFGGDGNDALYGDITDVAPAYHGNDYLDGEAGNDTLYGFGGSDTLYGGDGNDILNGDAAIANLAAAYHGNDYLDGGAGDDSIAGSAGNDTLFGGDGNDTLFGDAVDVASADQGNDYLDGGAGNDLVVGSGGSDTLYGGDGNDWVQGDANDVDSAYQGSDYLDGGSGNDSLLGGGGSDTLYGGDGNDQLYGDTGDIALAYHGNDYVDGGAGNDSITGYGGNDTLAGGSGADTYYYNIGDGVDVIDDLSTQSEIDTVVFGDGISVDDLTLTPGTDRLVITINSVVNGENVVGGLELLNFDSNDWFGPHAVGYFLFTDEEPYTLMTYEQLIALKQKMDGTDSADTITGNDQANNIVALDGNDVLRGMGNSDILNGGTGADTMYGGTGNDKYIVDNAGDAVTELVDEGNDTVESSISYTLTDNVEKLTLTGSGALSGTGNNLDNSITGNGWSNVLIGGAGNDTLNGSGGADTMQGGTGDDIYIVDDSGDVVTEFAGEGYDEVQSSVSYSLSENVEGLMLIGSNGINGTGNALDNTITGNSASNTLTGLAGDDILDGGAGNDILSGGDGDDILDGGAGNDILDGGLGNDTYYWAEGYGNDTIIETDGEDTLSSWSYSTDLEFGLSQNNNYNDIIIRNTYTDETLTLKDWFISNNNKIETFQFAETDLTAAQVQEMAIKNGCTGTEGDDYLQGPTNFGAVLSGLAGNDTIYGGSANDTLDGGTGNDILAGGAGNDTYIWGTGMGNDIIQDSNGTDTVALNGLNFSDVEFVISPYGGDDGILMKILSTGESLRIQNWFTNDESGCDCKIENFQFDDAIISASQIYEMSIALGLIGTEGNDEIYGPGSLGVTIKGLGGDDSIYSGNGWGGLDDTIFGGAGDDYIQDLRGNNVIDGGLGNDFINVRTGDNTLVWGPGQGNDTFLKDLYMEIPGGYNTLQLGGLNSTDVEFSLTTGIGENGIVMTIKSTGETLKLLHDYYNMPVDRFVFADRTLDRWSAMYIAEINGITGTEGNDVIQVPRFYSTRVDGLGGDDTIYCGYSGDSVYGGEGNDYLQGYIYSSNPHYPDYFADSSGNDVLYCGDGDDILKGGSGDDLLDGGTGNDVMRGGKDNDTYVVDSVGDIIVENPNEGDSDTVVSSITYTLAGTNIENLTLAGFDNISGVGNNSDNVLIGNAGANILDGGAGNDTIDGGLGDDTYLWTAGAGSDVIRDEGGNNTIQFGGLNSTNVTYGFSLYQNIDGDLQYDESIVLTNTSTGETLRLQNWFEEGSRQIRIFQFADKTLTGAEMEALVTADWIVGTDGDDVLSASDNVGAFINGRGGNDSLTGGTGNDVIYGGGGNDTVYGGTGNDYLSGGAGDDTVYGETGNDTIYGGDGNDYVEGESGDDDIRAGAGDDTIYGGNGNDMIYGEAGNDTIYGGDSDDQLWGGAGDDSLMGGIGNDTITGDDGNNWFDGGDGDDFIFVDAYSGTENGNNTIFGGDGNDGLYGGTGDDTIYGGAGDDTIDSGEGNNYIDGGDGNDSLSATCYLEPFGSVTMLGGAGNDTLSGFGSNEDYLAGGMGDDSYYSSAGTISEDGGNDTFFDSSGNWSDSYTFTVSPLNSNDLIVKDRWSVGNILTISNWFAGDQYKIENFVFGDVTFTIADLEALTTADRVMGTEFNDTLSSPGSSNTIIYGGGGNDTLSGGSGNDTLCGDTGSDTYLFARGSGQDSVADGTVMEFADIDKVVFTDVASPDDLNVTRDGNNLVIAIKGTQDSLTIRDQFWDDPNWSCDHKIEQFQFSDGTTISSSDIEAMIEQNIIQGTPGNDTLSGTPNVETIYGAAGDDSIDAGSGNDILDGGLGNDTLFGNDGNDILDGGPGNDLLLGAQGDDTYIFGIGSGNDTLSETNSGGNDTISFGTLNSTDVDVTIPLDASDDSIMITIRSAGESLRIQNWFTSDTYKIENFQFADTTLTASQVHAFATANGIAGTDGDDVIHTPYSFSTTVHAGAGNDTVYSGTAAQTIYGGNGNDNLNGDAGNDTLYGEDGSDMLFGNDGNDYISGGIGNDSLFGGAGSDILDGGAGDDGLQGGFDDDTYVWTLNSGNDTIYETGGNDTISLGSLQSTDVDYLISPNGVDSIILKIKSTGETLSILSWLTDDQYKIENFQFADTTLTASQVHALAVANGIVGTDGDDVITAPNSLSTTIHAGAGNDTVHAGTAAQIVYAGAGNDQVFGNIGNDILYGEDGSDALFGNSGNDALYGGTGNDNLYGQDGDDYLDGGAGNDTLQGGAGNDIYIIDSAGDLVYENTDEGIDTVQSSITHTLSANVENLTLTGTAAINGTGNTLDNILTGNSANNTLTGGAGNDTLDGATGNDTMIGGLGNDTYYANATGDVVTEIANEGVDTVNSSITYTLSANVENLTLTDTSAINGTGNTLDNILIGNSANNVLNGGLGADTMTGGLGNDTYYVDNAGEVIHENTGEGTDTVRASMTYTLGANVENLILTGTSAINGTGNDLSNSITGNIANNVLTGGLGNDVLNGGSGADTLIGGLGNDTYTVDNIGDVIIENTNEGTDIVNSSVTYTLSDNVENITLTGTSAINVTGNDLNNIMTGNSANNILTGNDGNDTLNGGTGADTLIGGLGNDTYTVDNVGDIITENLNEGADIVNSSVTYTLSDNVENLTLTGTAAINGTGNALDNYLTGNSAANILTGNDGNDTLNGRSGNDTMIGGIGNDTYYVNATGDVVTENTDEGIDSVMSAITYTLGANVENLTLTGTAAINGTGNDLDNVLTGNSANNTLNGGAGADTLIGGIGNDTYVIDNIGDVVIENANEGADIVNSSVTYTLSDNIEKLTLTGTFAINGTGNALDNYLTGNSAANILTGNDGNDTLNGRSGNDTMIGGIGNDTYYVNATGDVVTENLNEGTDAVNSSITYTLGSNVENLTLTGSSAINGTGNSLDNVLTGNSANNTLNGGAGNDTYVFSLGAGNDTVTDSGSDASTSDEILFGSDVLQGTVALFQSGQNLVIGYGSTDKVTITNQAAADYGVEKIQLNNGLFLTNTDVNLVIQQITAFASSHGITLTNVDNVRANQDLMNIIANAWHG